MHRIFRIIVIFLVFALPAHANNPVPDVLLKQGLEKLRNGDAEIAAQIFRDVLSRTELDDVHPESLYWLVKTDISIKRYREAAGAADRFLMDYPGHEHYSEMRYQRGRLLFLEEEPEKAVIALGNYIREYPDSPFAASARYWIGESLMYLGRLEEADAVFSDILKNYPASSKREASRYRQSEISQQYRERELLNLLKWSHEEYLRDAEEFYRRESEILDFRRNMTRSEQQKQFNGRMLEFKNDLLDIQSFYINELLGLANEK